MMILEIKATIWPRRCVQKSLFNIKILFGKTSRENWMLVFIKDEFSICYVHEVTCVNSKVKMFVKYQQHYEAKPL